MTMTSILTNYIYADFDIEMPKQNDGDILKDIDIDSVKNSIINILQTKRGSRRMLPTFGCSLDRMLFEPMDEQSAHVMGMEMLSSIQIWEPRISLENINVFPDYDNNQYNIDITFSIVGFNRNVGLGTLNFILKEFKGK